jgi:hypothetical protein
MVTYGNILALRDRAIGKVGAFVPPEELPVLSSHLLEPRAEVNLFGFNFSGRVVVEVLILWSIVVQIFGHVASRFLKVFEK